MISFKIKKNYPLRIKDKLSNEIIEIFVPSDYKSSALRILLNLPERFIIMKDKVKQEEFNSDGQDEYKDQLFT